MAPGRGPFPVAVAATACHRRPNTAGPPELFHHDGAPLHLVSGHRGGARPGFPENCVATFEDTIRHTFAILEVDPRYTKDGAIVLHHDPTLERTTTGTGPVVERTLEELKGLRLKGPDGNVTEHRIPTLDEALEWARGKTVLVLDRKDVPVEVTVRKVAEHQAEAYAILIVYSFQEARRCHELNENIMMEVMITNREKFREFDATGVPWRNVVAFVGHEPPRDEQLLRMIHEKGTCCIAGTSRNLDRELHASRAGSTATVTQDYHNLLRQGVDLIETDRPREVGRLLYGDAAAPDSRAEFLRRR